MASNPDENTGSPMVHDPERKGLQEVHEEKAKGN